MSAGLGPLECSAFTQDSIICSPLSGSCLINKDVGRQYCVSKPSQT